MRTPAQTVPNQGTTETTGKSETRQPTVILKEGKSGLRFGPVTSGQVALGKDGCGY